MHQLLFSSIAIMLPLPPPPMVLSVLLLLLLLLLLPLLLLLLLLLFWLLVAGGAVDAVADLVADPVAVEERKDRSGRVSFLS